MTNWPVTTLRLISHRWLCTLGGTAMWGYTPVWITGVVVCCSWVKMTQNSLPLSPSLLTLVEYTPIWLHPVLCIFRPFFLSLASDAEPQIYIIFFQSSVYHKCLVSTGTGIHVWTGQSSCYATSDPGQLSLATPVCTGTVNSRESRGPTCINQFQVFK